MMHETANSKFQLAQNGYLVGDFMSFQFILLKFRSYPVQQL
jgi:hypothetical protein